MNNTVTSREDGVSNNWHLQCLSNKSVIWNVHITWQESSGKRWIPPHKGSVIRKAFPCHDVTRTYLSALVSDVRMLVMGDVRVPVVQTWPLEMKWNFVVMSRVSLDWAIRRIIHDDVIKWKHFSRCWPFVRGIHRSLANSPRKGQGQWRGALMFSLICTRINGWVNNREAGDLRRYRGHYDVIVMI